MRGLWYRWRLTLIGAGCVLLSSRPGVVEDRPADNVARSETQQQQRDKVKVYRLSNFFKLEEEQYDGRLVAAVETEKHDASVIWSADMKGAFDWMPLAIESMYVRLQRSGKISESQEGATPNGEQMKQMLQNFTAAELNQIDPEWKLFLLEWSDRGVGNWPRWHMELEMAPLFGWKRINYATRTTQTGRSMGAWAKRALNDPFLPFGDYAGRPINFTAEWNAKNSWRSIQRLSLTVRQDILKAVDAYVKDQHPSSYEEASRNATLLDTSLRLSEAIARLPRPTDVRTFWNASVCNMACAFRNRIAEIVQSLPERHGGSIRANTDVVGFIHKRGRNSVHPDFIDGMLTTKIIVLAQRDEWEGHSRLYEMLLSGALVMSDPQVYWPHGTVDGENIVVYHSWADLEEKILFYLNPTNAEERIRIGQRGREVALTHHQSSQQAERLFLNDMSYRSEFGLANKPW